MTTIDWRMGVEIELLAPPGKSRRDLADAIAQRDGGTVRRFFHAQSEPSKVPGTPVFHNLTLGFEVVCEQQGWTARCVDDLTLQSDLTRKTPPRPGWYRVISDDERFLRLVAEQAHPEQPLGEVLKPLASLFGTPPEPGPGGMIRVNDRSGASIAIVVPLPGERERPCELITAPIEQRHGERLDTLLGLARSLGFTAPSEGATHLHFDATAVQSAAAIANLVHLLWRYGDLLKELMGTNPRCRRLGPWPQALLDTVSAAEFRGLTWPEAQARLKPLKLSKYCDFNLANCIEGYARQNTIEVRILPVWLESAPIMNAAALFVAILRRAIQPEPVPLAGPPPASVRSLLETLGSSGSLVPAWEQPR